MFLRLLVTMLLLNPVAGLFAQTQREKSLTITIEYLNPHFKGLFDNDIRTSVLFLSGRFPVWGSKKLIVELPFAHAAAREFSDRSLNSETVIGNPYLGLQFIGKSMSGEIGLRLPLIQESSKFRARFIGQLADFDRQEAFLADFTTVSGRVGYRQKSTHDILVKFYSGLSVIFNSFGIDGFLDYGGQFGYQSSRFEILAGVTGRVLVTIGDPGDPNVTQIAVSGAVTLDRWRPGLVFRLPLDDDLDPMDFVIGLKLGVVLK